MQRLCPHTEPEPQARSAPWINRHPEGRRKVGTRRERCDRRPPPSQERHLGTRLRFHFRRLHRRHRPRPAGSEHATSFRDVRAHRRGGRVGGGPGASLACLSREKAGLCRRKAGRFQILTLLSGPAPDGLGVHLIPNSAGEMGFGS